VKPCVLLLRIAVNIDFSPWVFFVVKDAASVPVSYVIDAVILQDFFMHQNVIQ
jgi:hypothetical protein